MELLGQAEVGVRGGRQQPSLLGLRSVRLESRQTFVS